MKTFLTYTFLFCITHFTFGNPADNLSFTHIGKSSQQGTYSVKSDVHTLDGVGTNVWSKRDNFDFASIRLSGDMQITARIVSLDQVDESTKAGIMIRNNLTPESMFAFMYFSPKSLSFDYRVLHRYSCRNNTISTIIQLPYWVKLIRKGNQYISQRSKDGKEWHTVEIKTINMDDTVCYGLAVASNDTVKKAKAVFDHVSIEKYETPFTPEMQNALVKRINIYSESVKDSFEIMIGLPLNYKSTASTIYPVAYHLDGGDVDDHYVIRNLMTDKLVPEVITVGIGYVESKHQRERDYRHGFDLFYQFMKNELIPFIDSVYNTDTTNRTLYGYSYGGLCCMQTLWKYGEDGDAMPFNGIISGSPTIVWKSGDMNSNFKSEASLNKTTKKLPINFYMCMGSKEGTGMVAPFKKMTNILDKRSYLYFNFKSQLNNNLNHASNKRVCYKEGYLWLLNQPLPNK